MIIVIRILLISLLFKGMFLRFNIEVAVLADVTSIGRPQNGLTCTQNQVHCYIFIAYTYITNMNTNKNTNKEIGILEEGYTQKPPPNLEGAYSDGRVV